MKKKSVNNKSKSNTVNEPEPAALTALKRAALEARKIALQTGTPLWIMEGNKLIDATKSKKMKKGGRPKS